VTRDNHVSRITHRALKIMTIESHHSHHQTAVRLFLKGNGDLTASLLSRQEGGAALAQGFREWVSEKHNGTFKLQIHHEPSWRSDLLLQQLEGVAFPDELRRQGLDESFITAQFQSRLFTEPAEVAVLSIQPEIEHELWQRREGGYLLQPPPDWRQRWSPAQRNWFEANFAAQGYITVARFHANMTRLVRYLQDELKARVVVYGCSSFDPADASHNYAVTADPPSVRAHRLNYALIQLSQQEEISLVDVDRIIAELGGRAHVRRFADYSPEAYQAIGREFFRITEEIGLFKKQSALLKLILPQFDNQFQSGSIVRWHKQEGEWVQAGDHLLDIKVEEIKRYKRTNAGQADEELEAVEMKTRNWSWLVRLTASDDGFLRKKYVAEAGMCAADDLLAVLSREEDGAAAFDEAAVANAALLSVAVSPIEESI
jgi:hypothetical protein